MYNTQGFGNAWLQYREDIFEKVRLERFPDKPSRLESVFLCENEADMRNFVTETSRGLDVLYEVEIVDPSKPQHRGCLSKIDIQQKENYRTFEKRAFEYWNATTVSKPEIVTASPIKILKAL